ncbi:hypothetical protein AB0N17_12650 [Streptomyces sp. NPDC051133]|uniref:hypothetical protein n=1 Tax=Streptomyces sp. NPDC051133 TaxID=3155521 RepID=UPI003424425B
MTSSNSRAWIAGCALAASVFTLASCTSSGGADGATRPSSAPSSSPTAAGPSERQLTQRAEDALAAVGTGRLFESGAERVTDGVHSEAKLDAGTAYRLSVVCFGSGSAHMTLSPPSAGARSELPCDQSVLRRRITATGRLRLDVDAAGGATGVIAWRIDTV